MAPTREQRRFSWEGKGEVRESKGESDWSKMAQSRASVREPRVTTQAMKLVLFGDIYDQGHQREKDQNTKKSSCREKGSGSAETEELDELESCNELAILL